MFLFYYDKSNSLDYIIIFMSKETINIDWKEITLSISAWSNCPSSENKYCNVHFENKTDYTVLHIWFSLKFLLINKKINMDETVRYEIDELLENIWSIDSLFQVEERFVFYTSQWVQNKKFHPFIRNDH